MRLIDADFLLSYTSDMEVQTGKKCCANAVKTCIDEFFPYVVADCPTIDPESLPIVQQLRAELARVTAERDKIAQYELDACDEYCFGDSSTGIHECEWLDSNDRCKLKEWAEGRKETDRE